MTANNTPNRVNLDFVDLLYAVPVAALATRVGESNIEHLSASTWGDIGLALFALTLGWIGHHSNRQRRDEEAPDPDYRHEQPFIDGSFFQFCVEVFVIGAYFALSARLSLPGRPAPLNGELEWKAWWLLGLFALYLVWDVLDIWIAMRRAKRADSEASEAAPAPAPATCNAPRAAATGDDYRKWADRAFHGLLGTALFLVVFGAVRLSVSGGPYRTLVFDVICIVLLYLYRVGQHAWIGAAAPGAKHPTRTRAVIIAGVAFVVLLWATGVLSSWFSAERVPMVIRRLRPAHGPASGDTSIAATGEYFDEHGTTFTLGAVRATDVTCKSATECTLVTPALQLTASKAAVVDVVASLRDGDAKSNAFHYTYRRVPLEHVDRVVVELSQHGRALLRHRLGPACRNDDLNGLLEPGSASPPSVQTFATDRCPRLHLRVTRAIGTVFVAHRVG
ncbi:MAG TPA: IPT/TIG domain-containing protein [Solirubrobacteraceae bacterium]|jgi:hypothetical protein|nr:IPT/TIG domain-containing protein [Solirubrobacteraceae bacterium]